MIDAIKEAVVGLDFKCWVDAIKDFIKTNSYQITITAGVILGIVVLTFLICVLIHKSKRIGIAYSCPEGNFRAKENAKRFVIKKGRRFGRTPMKQERIAELEAAIAADYNNIAGNFIGALDFTRAIENARNTSKKEQGTA